MGNFLVWVVWLVAAAGCLGSGLAVVTLRNPFFSALALIGNLGSLAVLFLLASAEFLAAAQVLVYAGAVMVMFLFVIAYLGDRVDEHLGGCEELGGGEQEEHRQRAEVPDQRPRRVEGVRERDHGDAGAEAARRGEEPDRPDEEVGHAYELDL